MRTAAQNRWRTNNREKHLAQKRAWAARWRVKNPELKKERDHACYLRTRKERIEAQKKLVAKYDKEHLRAIKRRSYDKYRERDKPKRRQAVKLYRAKNPAKVLAFVHARRARMLAAEGKFGSADVARLYEEQIGLCASCRIFLSRFHVDHIVPLCRGGSNWPSNLQLLCPPCNLKKHKKLPEELRAI